MKQLDYILRELDVRKGSWPRLAQESGVPLRTIEKIASRRTRYPRIDTVEKLASYLSTGKRLAVLRVRNPRTRRPDRPGVRDACRPLAGSA